MENKKPLPVSFKLALLLFFVSLQCFLGALYIKERESYYKLESEISSPPKISRIASENLPSQAEDRGSSETHNTLIDAVEPLRAISSFEKTASENVIVKERTSSYQHDYQPKPVVKKVSGTLWFDKQNNNYVITIGRRNGIEEGNLLKIYDSGEIIGEARVVRPMEKLSIVEIDETYVQKLSRTYYKVSSE